MERLSGRNFGIVGCARRRTLPELERLQHHPPGWGRFFDGRDGELGHDALVRVVEHRIIPESSAPVESTKLALAGADVSSRTNLYRRGVALMRPFLIPALAAGN
jgi:hypothetical protein